jgi:hypothetical protein
MVSATLSVAVYRRVEHSKSHWAIHLLTRKDGEEEHIIYQAAGDEGKLSVEIREGVDPANSQRLMELILVSELDSTKVVEEARDIMSNQPVQNEVPLWTCQDWVMETLEALSDAELLDQYTYDEAKEKLEGVFRE